MTNAPLPALVSNQENIDSGKVEDGEVGGCPASAAQFRNCDFFASGFGYTKTSPPLETGVN
jgi:hypothetical protein